MPSYDDSEISNHGGSPLELYHFTLGPVHYRYTSGDAAVDYLGSEYLPAALSRGAIDRGGDLNRAELSITAPRDFAPADRFRIYPPTEVMRLVVYRQHRGADGTSVLWSGRVIAASWSGSRSSLRCEPVATSLLRPGLRRKRGRQCPHVLYGSECTVNQLSRTVSGSVSAAAGKTVSAAAFSAHADGHFDGGPCDWLTDEGVVERRMVMTHVGDTLTLSAPFYGIAFGQPISAAPGCKRTLADCETRFSNTDNYGGWPFKPNSSPFGGKIIY